MSIWPWWFSYWGVGVVLAGFFCRADSDGLSEGSGTVAARSPSVLFALNAKPWIDQYVDPQVKVSLNQSGWAVGSTEFNALSWEQLRKFNVLVLCRLTQERKSDRDKPTTLETKAPILQRFLDGGGGLLLLHDESYDRAYEPVCRFLEPFGAKILNEQVTDPEHQWHQPDFLQYWFAWTTDVAAGHPITDGVRTLWYPEGHSPAGDRKTCPLQVDASWTVLARAMPSAYSFRAAKGPLPEQKSITSAPPILAARVVGAGRMVLFSSHSTFTLQAGHHKIWENIVWERGDSQHASDTGRMLFNAMTWLAEPSRQSVLLGGFTQPAEPKPSSDVERIEKPGKQPAMQAGTFRGLIGAHSRLSDGEGTVGEWAAAARRRGYDFLVFTESFPPMSEPRWQELIVQCRAASDARFLCVPGLDFRDERGDRFASFDFTQWPKDEWLNKTKDRIEKLHGFYFGSDWPPIAVVDTAHNPVGPWFLKFYGALSIFGYRVEAGRCRCTDDALDAYLRLMGNQYNSVPIVFHDMHKPADLDAAEGFLNHAWALKLADAPRAFRHGWYAQPQSVYISEGARFAAWWIENPYSNELATDRPGQPWALHLEVRSATPLRAVTIYDGRTPFRRFAVAGCEFSRTVSSFHDRQHYFVAIAEDAQGRRAVSPTLRTGQARHSIYMCTDMQNTLEGGLARDRNGHLSHMGMMGFFNTGWDGFSPGILTGGNDLMPKGLDYVVKGFRGGMSHHLIAAEGRESAIARLDMVFGSGDCVILDSEFASHFLPGQQIRPTALADTHARLFSFTQRIYSHNLLLLERETMLKKTIHSSGNPVDNLEMLQLGGPGESFANYAYVDRDGKLIGGKRPDPTRVVVTNAELRAGGYAAIYPDFYGSGCVFPLSSEIKSAAGQSHVEPIHLRLRGAHMTLGYSLNGSELAAGTRLRQTFLIMRARFGDSSSACFEDVRRVFGLDGPPAYTVHAHTGSVKQSRYTLDLEADGGAAVVEIGPAALPSDLPIRVSGLYDRCSAVCLSLPEFAAHGHVASNPGSLSWRLIGTFNGTGYATADIGGHAVRFFLGHPMLCDAPELTLNLLEWSVAGLRVEIHNPSTRDVAAQVRVHPLLGAGGCLVRVPPESSTETLLPWQ